MRDNDTSVFEVDDPPRTEKTLRRSSCLILQTVAIRLPAERTFLFTMHHYLAAPERAVE